MERFLNRYQMTVMTVLFAILFALWCSLLAIDSVFDVKTVDATWAHWAALGIMVALGACLAIASCFAAKELN